MSAEAASIPVSVVKSCTMIQQGTSVWQILFQASPHICPQFMSFPSQLGRSWRAGMHFFTAFPCGALVAPSHSSGSPPDGISLKRTNQPCSQVQNQEFASLKYIFGNLFCRHVGPGCVHYNVLQSPLEAQYGRSAPSGGRHPWAPALGLTCKSGVSPLWVLSIEATLLVTSHYFCLLQETTIIFICFCTGIQHMPSSAVICNCHCPG